MDALVKGLWVGLGGFLGANARYWVGGWVTERWGAQFPWGTLVVNVSGSFLLGLIATWLTERTAAPVQVRLLVPIGFIGAYTTFSTFEYETLMLSEGGSGLRALGNIALSVVLGFAAVWVGVRIARGV